MRPVLLLAEGDAELRDVYRRFLATRGFDVVVAEDGVECMQKLDEAGPDVLVLDLELNWGGGDGVLAWLREEPHVPLVPVVLTATAGAPQLFLERDEPPVVECLPKPFTLAALHDSVRAALAQGFRVSRHRHKRVPSELFIG